MARKPGKNHSTTSAAGQLEQIFDLLHQAVDASWNLVAFAQRPGTERISSPLFPPHEPLLHSILEAVAKENRTNVVQQLGDLIDASHAIQNAMTAEVEGKLRATGLADCAWAGVPSKSPATWPVLWIMHLVDLIGNASNHGGLSAALHEWTKVREVLASELLPDADEIHDALRTARAVAVRQEEMIGGRKPVTPGSRVRRNELNFEARSYLQKKPSATAEQVAEEIGCGVRTVKKLPSWKSAKEKQRSERSVRSPRTGSLTEKQLAVKGTGVRDEVLNQLIEEQEEDFEPSPLEQGSDAQSIRTRHRKRL